MNFVFATFWTAFALHVVYHTDAIVAYLQLAPLRILNRFTKIKNYQNACDAGCDLSYSEYMLAYHNSFLVRLFACRMCFGVWLSLLTAVLTQQIEFLPAIYFASIFVSEFFNATVRRLQHL